jgi:hypothetical protein
MDMVPALLGVRLNPGDKSCTFKMFSIMYFGLAYFS